MNIIDVVVATDATYAPYCLSLFQSIALYNNENDNLICVHLLCRSKKNDFEWINSILALCEREKICIKIYKLEQETSVTCKQLDSGAHISSTTMDRLLIPDLLPISLKRVVYIDVDTIVIGKLKLILEEAGDCGIKGIAAADDCSNVYTETCAKEAGLTLSTDEKYFNAGVLVLNLERLRDLNATQVWKDVAMKYGVNDQVILNWYCAGQHVRLSPRCNYIYQVRWNQNDAPIIVHFCGEYKPWNKKLYARMLLLEALWHWFSNYANGIEKKNDCELEKMKVQLQRPDVLKFICETARRGTKSQFNEMICSME